MAKAKKFGTFSGVFTPSILTILGVIMYLRFPQIIGQAGLINTIGIIVIAHIISITTSMSVASLSTDKPVQNGGTYFMISRSLGLPIGGTLGLALFVGLSFSVSLYLIGFAESFIQYWGFENNIFNIRLYGTAVLVLITTITFISTSLAIKSQYFIMAAIGLSLLSIFFGKHEFAPTEINLTPMVDAAPFMILFGIFFPAVTGFEAGVSMSGDLQNPRKSLPVGAMLAVGVGFIVYLFLAFFYAYTVDANALANDPQILFKISLVPALVIAGIWGATLSSALGSILGAPRILQAIAMDKIAPRFFAKGTGKTNEPRNALLLAFVIAEAGILIGELDVIARIVSMFFITTYAFLNLASAIESWSSSDFRPAFKIPRFVSIVGAISAFIVMILLDFIALAGATVVLGILFLYLRRKELILESGDAWSGFWTNLAKRALLRLSIQKADKRNWRPNIILFSGGEKARPHLVELGLSLSGKLGALTDFNLTSDTKKSEQQTHIQRKTKKKKGKSLNYFIRQFPSNTLEEGIKSVTNVYGFNGFEPNTVLMGWSHKSKKADFLLNTLKDLRSKKLNTIFLDYEKEKGFGKKETIDIWWNGKGRLLSFALNIVKFLLTDKAWRDAELRILIVNNNTTITDSLYRNTSLILNDKRIKAEIKIISDDFGSRTIDSIIKSESTNTDLALLGLPQQIDPDSKKHLESINKIAKLPTSKLFLSPSEEFDEIILAGQTIKTDLSLKTSSEPINIPEIPNIENTVVKNKLIKLDSDLLEIVNSCFVETIHKTVNNNLVILKKIKEFTNQNRENLNREIIDADKFEIKKSIVKNHQTFLRIINTIIDTHKKESSNEVKFILENGINNLVRETGNLLYEIQESFTTSYTDSKKKKELSLKIQLHKQVNYYFNITLYPELNNQLNKLDEVSVDFYSDLRKVLFGINDTYEKKLINTETLEDKSVFADSDFQNDYLEIEQSLINFTQESKVAVAASVRSITSNLASELADYSSARKSNKRKKTKDNQFIEFFTSFTENHINGVNLINNTLLLDTLMLSEQKKSKNIIHKGNERIKILLSDMVFQPIEILLKNLEECSSSNKNTGKDPGFPNHISIKTIFNDFHTKASEIISLLPEEIELPESLINEAEQILLNEITPSLINLNKTGQYYFDLLFYEPCFRDMEQLEKTANDVIIECKEVNSMLMFRLNNIQSENYEHKKNALITSTFYTNLIKQVNIEKAKLEKSLIRVNRTSLDYIGEVYSTLYYHAIIDSENKISSQRIEQQSKKFNIGISKTVNKIKTTSNNFIIGLLNKTSSGIILSKKYLSESTESKAQIKDILDLVEEITPERKAYNNVPVFYRSLMSSSSKINDDFWVKKDKEITMFKNAMQRHKSGLGGAVLIRGVHGAGKTTLSRYVANHFFKKNNVFWIESPVNGSCKTDDFLVEIRKQVVSLDDFEKIFNNIPHESIVIINDLELWWERSANGNEVLEKIIELIEIYGKRILFLINCNTFSFNIIKTILPFQEHLLSIIDCEYLNTNQIQSLILNRHKSSGINLKYNNKEEDQISPLNLSLLFNAYFNCTMGHPGMVINMWKSNITDASSDSITIKKPVKPNIDILYKIDQDWLVVIALFFQHKSLDVDKLCRLTNYSMLEANNLLNNLVNSGIIISKTDSVYTIGRNIEPFLAEICVNKGII